MLEKFERDLSNREVIDQKILLLQKKKKKGLDYHQKTAGIFYQDPLKNTQWKWISKFTHFT